MRARVFVFRCLFCAFLLLGSRGAFGQSLPSSDSGARDPGSTDSPCPDGWSIVQETDQTAPKGPPPGLGTIAWKDAGILIAPLHWTGKDWLLFSGAVAGVVVLGAFADEPVRTFTQDHRTRALDRVTKAVAPFGQQYGWAVIGAYGVAGFVFRDPPSREIAVDSAITIVLASGIISPALKIVIGRSRPDRGEGATSYHPFSAQFGNTSFPAGHATEAFAIASVISAHSDRLWVNVSAYTLASLVGFSRVYQDVHWTSDVLGGALIGTAVGHAVVALNRKLRHGEHEVHVALAPIAGNGRRGAGLALIF